MNDTTIKFNRDTNKQARTKKMLTISKISKHFGPKTLFKDLSFQLNAGDRVGLVGANGAGKSTLFSMILWQTEADSGQIELERERQLGFTSRKRSYWMRRPY